MNIYLIEWFPLPTMSFEFFCSHWVVLVCPLFFFLTKSVLCWVWVRVWWLPSPSMQTGAFWKQAKKEWSFLSPKPQRYKINCQKTCLQEKLTSCLSLLFLTWLHTGFINLLWILSLSAVKSQLFQKWAVADPAKLLLDMAVCKSLSSTLDLKTGNMRALIISLNLNPVWSVHMPVTSVKNSFQLLKLVVLFFFKYKEHLCLSWDTFFSLHWAFLKPAPLCELCGEPFGEQLRAI